MRMVGSGGLSPAISVGRLIDLGHRHTVLYGVVYGSKVVPGDSSIG